MVVFKPFEKQQQFIDAVFSGEYRYLFYGGGARGGKTYTGIAILILLCKIFPNSKWHVLRKDFQKLKETSIPTFHKLCPKKFLIKFIDGIAYFNNGSQIHFNAENFKQDKDLNWMDGLETNGFLFEEVQELQEKTFNKAKLRAGSNILATMPPIILICTGNPSQNWSKKVFVQPHREGTLEKPYYFLQAVMADNPNLPEEYKKGMDTLDTITYRRYVLGDWDVIDVDKPFAYSFSLDRHVKKLNKPLQTLPLYLAFDFNVDPMTCCVVQTNLKTFIRFHKEYRLRDSNITRLCAEIMRDFGDYYFYVTGDQSGENRNAALAINENFYTIILKELKLSPKQIVLPSKNPYHKDNRILVNSLLEKFPEVSFDPDGCPFLVQDFLYCEVNGLGDIDKTKDKHQGHLLDGARYHFNTWHNDFIKWRF